MNDEEYRKKVEAELLARKRADASRSTAGKETPAVVKEYKRMMGV